MAYKIVVTRKAQKQLASLPRDVFARVDSHIKRLSDNPRPPNAIMLKGSSDYRMRIGNYRVIYMIDDAAQSVEVTAVGHRKDIYRS